MNLELLAAQSRACTACALAAGRTQVVFGEGSPDARLLFVGDGPDEEAEAQGKPLSGRSAQLLEMILQAAGIPGESVYVTHVVKCRPADGPAPGAPEVKTCTGQWLNQQIEYLRPQVIVPMGAAALEFFTGERRLLSQARGRVFAWHGVPVIPMYGPAYLVKQPSREAGSPKHLAWQDIQLVKKTLDEAGPKAGLEINAASQESLF